MNLPKKPGPGFTQTPIGQIADHPKEPEAMKKRFPEFEGRETAIANWWGTVRDQIKRTLADLQTQIDALSQAGSSAGVTSEELATLRTDLTEQIQAAVQSITEVQEHEASTQAALLEHIESNSTHGVTGEIIGGQGVQKLDSKTIGQHVPGYGRFSPLISTRTIPTGTEVAIGVDDAMIVAQPFVVEGALVVEGIFLAL